MLHADDARVHDGRLAGALLDAAHVRLDPAPVAVADVQVDGRVGVDVEDRVGMQVAVGSRLPVLGVVERQEARTRDHDERVDALPLGMLLHARRRVLERRQRVEGQPGLARQVLDDRGIQLHLARRREELVAGFLVLLELLLAGHVLHVAVELLVREPHGRQLEVQHVLGLRAPPLVLLAQADGQAVEELVVVAEVHVGAALEALQHARLRAEVHGAVVHHGVAVVRALEPRGGRQRVVGQRRGRRHEVVVHHQEVQVHEGLYHELRVRERHDRVVGLHDEGLHRIGVAVAHGAEQKRRVAVRVERRVGLRDDVPALEREAGEAVVADHLVALLLRERVVLVERRGEARRGRQLVAALLVDVSRDGAQDGLAADGTGGVDAARVAALLPPRQASRLRGGVHAGRLADLIGGYPGDLGHLLGRVVLGALLELLEPHAPLVHELVVVEILLDDHVDPAECERRVGAGADLQEQIGLLGHLAEARVDDHELGAALLAVRVHPVPQKRLRCDGVAAPQHYEVGVHPVRLIGAEAAVGAGLEPHVAGVADGAVAARVRAAEQVRELVVQPAPRARRALGEGERLGPVLVAQLGQLVGYLVERLVPGDLLPLAAAALAHALERLLQAVRVVHESL